MKALVFLLAILCFSFSACEQKENPDMEGFSPFSGYWEATDMCSGNKYEYVLHVFSSSSDINLISLTNLSDMGYSTGVTATVTGTTFVIHPQNINGYDITGQGYISPSHDSLFYQWQGGPHGSCSAEARLRQ